MRLRIAVSIDLAMAHLVLQYEHHSQHLQCAASAVIYSASSEVMMMRVDTLIIITETKMVATLVFASRFWLSQLT